MREQPNIYAAGFSLSMAATSQKPSYAHLDADEAIEQYTLRMLFIDFR